MNVVGGIKLPKSADISDLYIQCNESALIKYSESNKPEGNKKVVLSQGGTVSSNSYFNSFYERFYAKYTTLHSIYYRLKLEGDFKVSVYREVNRSNGKEAISEEIFEKCQVSNPVELPPINLLQDKNAGRIYIEITCLSEQGLFEGGWIATDEPKARETSLGIVICTFKKEDYIKNTLTTILQDKLLQDKEFKVFVVDNGRTLDKANFRDSRLKLIPNINAGGSGGFTRGLVEALEENVYSHFLLMDDDIELESESIYRLFSLHEYAKSDFAVAGGLLNLHKKHILYEAGATYNENPKTRGFAPGSLTALNHNIDLRNADSLNNLLTEADADYGGFWFFSFSKELVEKIKLPLPLFIKIDDIEFCLRIKKVVGSPIVTFPSIAVWHQPASAKNLNWETYYYARNDLITYAIHFSSEYTHTVGHFTKAIIHSVDSSDYDRAQMLIKAFEDYLKGPDFIKNSEPEVLHLSILKLSRSYESQSEIDQLAGTKLLVRWFEVAAKGGMEWSSVTRDWKGAAKEMTSILFWQQYLGLEKPHTQVLPVINEHAELTTTVV
jgi:galactofuranosylgalactofuranosylrhamnosyl-N-acetylglucosaminyl-diphospho-decaprenol beta-1,5/1,6-galactofuranosyltransferase